uniref:Small ribosomal subunit protein eS19 n=1 Tax=Ignisphaera aggregans TaxID=334771 RepID=A0A7C4FDY3_9CREN
MVTARDVPADMLIEKLAEYLKSSVPTVKPPNWAFFAKTGSHRERVPDNPDWWYIRAAAILRKLYLAEKPIGIEKFRIIFGGLKRRGSAPPHFRKCGGSNIRKILQQLERAGLVKRVSKGRVISDEGRRLLDRIAFEVFKELLKVKPELTKYAPKSLVSATS